jgi:hypothetical protein
MKCGFSIDYVSSNDDSAVKLTEDEEDDWHCLPLGVQFEDYTCDSAPEDCESSVDQVLDQHLIRPEVQVDKVLEFSSSHGGEYDVQSFRR